LVSGYLYLYQGLYRRKKLSISFFLEGVLFFQLIYICWNILSWNRNVFHGISKISFRFFQWPNLCLFCFLFIFFILTLFLLNILLYLCSLPKCFLLSFKNMPTYNNFYINISIPSVIVISFIECYFFIVTTIF